MRRSIISIFFLLSALAGVAQSSVTVDFGAVTKANVPRGAASLNLCWLLDSDLKRPNPKQSFESALVEMGVGSAAGFFVI
ncbi:MAG: hypothetical protein R3Y68_03435, partial [Rikenellaceae bacterium]